MEFFLEKVYIWCEFQDAYLEPLNIPVVDVDELPISLI